MGVPPAADRIRIATPAQAWFASDMHLDDGRPGLSMRFLEALDRLADALAPAASADVPPDERPALFLLGDLFEVWTGDDAAPDIAVRVADRLRALNANGCRIHLMRGNRDFLIDAPIPRASVVPYTTRCAARLLDDPAVVTIGSTDIMLSHGDLWCTDDPAYMAWRERSRSPEWQHDVLRRSRLSRRLIGRWARWRSRHRHVSASPVPDDVAMTAAPDDISPTSLNATMDRMHVAAVIHGHTHRPALHRWTTDRGPRWRWVLPDWSATPGRERGEILSLAQVLDGHRTGTRD